MTGKWEYDEDGNSVFDCQCLYCLGFIDNVPVEHFSGMEQEMFFQYLVTRPSGVRLTILTETDPTEIVFDAIDVETIGQSEIEVK